MLNFKLNYIYYINYYLFTVKLILFLFTFLIFIFFNNFLTRYTTFFDSFPEVEVELEVELWLKEISQLQLQKHLHQLQVKSPHVDLYFYKQGCLKTIPCYKCIRMEFLQQSECC